MRGPTPPKATNLTWATVSSKHKHVQGLGGYTRTKWEGYCRQALTTVTDHACVRTANVRRASPRRPHTSKGLLCRAQEDANRTIAAGAMFPNCTTTPIEFDSAREGEHFYASFPADC
eukprot:850066-Prorocentrum_minimum.AAC.7